MADEVLRNLREVFTHDERFASATLLKTIVPFKRKFFEDEHHRNKTFMHRWRDNNRNDRLDTVIRRLCEELFPEIVAKPLPETAATGHDVAEA